MRPLLLALLLLAAESAAKGPPRTFRIDYFHTGNATDERFSLDRLVLEPLPWPGNPARSLDDTGAGKYLFEVRELSTQRPLYSRGFASIYGEWETTDEAKRENRTYHESLRFPAPERPVQVSLKKRDPVDLSFREVWSLVVDPSDTLVDTSRPPSPGPVLEVQRKGDPAHKLDLLLVGDGYTAAERAKFEKDARRLAEALFTYSPFKERRGDFNVWAVAPAAEESGISRPSTGVHRRTRVGATYDAFGAERYILTFDNRSLHDVASAAPYDFLAILANGRTYGGGGIHNLYATVAADNLFAPYVFVHELGHSIAGLADEYYTSDSVYESAAERLEPWEPNVTALRDPKKLKWKELLAGATPLPTPWEKEKWESWQREVQKRRREIRAARRPESEMDAHFTEEKALATRMLRAERHFEKVGAFEGASYEAKGYYRPEVDCVMFTRNDVPFCAVCQRALSRVIDLYARR